MCTSNRLAGASMPARLGDLEAGDLLGFRVGLKGSRRESLPLDHRHHRYKSVMAALSQSKILLSAYLFLTASRL